MNLRLHPRSVAPAEGHEKCGPRRPTRSGYSCNNAPFDTHDELAKGNIAVGIVVGAIFVGVGIAIGLVVGMGLN